MRDGFRIAKNAKMKSIGLPLLLVKKLRGEKDVPDVALMMMTAIRDFSYPGLTEILLHCSDEKELAVVKAVGMQIFDSLAKPVKSAQETLAEQASLLMIPTALQFAKRCIPFLATLTLCRDTVKGQINRYDVIPLNWQSILTLIENLTTLFEMISDAARSIHEDQLKAVSDTATMTAVNEGLMMADRRVAEATSLGSASTKACLASEQAAKDALVLARRVQAAAKTLYNRVEKLQNNRAQYQKAIQKARKTSHVDLADCVSADLLRNDMEEDGIIGASMLHDESTRELVRHNARDIAITETRGPMFTDGLPTFENMTPQEKKILLDELHARKDVTKSTAVEVNMCAHIMKRVLEKGDAQVTSGADIRSKIVKVLAKRLPDYLAMLKEGKISATICVYGLRHARHIMPSGRHGYPVNDEKARWAEPDEELWNNLSGPAQDAMINAEEYFGEGGANRGKDDSRVLELGLMLEMTDAFAQQWRKDQTDPRGVVYGVRLPTVDGNLTNKPCHVTTGCRALQLGRRYLNIDKRTQHSGLSRENWITQLSNPLIWSSKIDPTGIDHKNLRGKLNGQTEDCPEGIDGNLLFNALLMFSKWLTWQVAFPGLVCDRQLLHEFICKSGYDRSVALAVAFAGVVFGVWGIVIDIQYMSFQDGANEGRNAPHARWLPGCRTSNSARWPSRRHSEREPCEQCKEESHPSDVWKVIKDLMLTDSGDAQEDARLDAECPARIPAKKVIDHFLNLRANDMAAQIISELVEECVIDDLSVDQGCIANVLKVAGSKSNRDPLLLPTTHNSNLWRLGLILDPRCLGCRDIKWQSRTCMRR